MKNKIITLIVLILIYLLLKHYIPYGNYIVYPINLMVTFMHEFWHAFFALVTWWSVNGLTVNSDWSWLTTTTWGIRSIVLMWWYIWSAIFWNILLYIGFKKEKISKQILYFISWLMFFVAIFWFDWIISFILISLLWLWLFFLAYKTKYSSLVLQFLGISSIIYIIEDFNVWPSSDLANFSTIIPSYIWMIVWLVIVLIITIFNLKLIFKK